jgi:plastocyanin
LFLVASLAAAALLVPGSVAAHGTVTQPLIATVGTPTSGNNFVISLKDSTGAQVTHVDPGTYTITVHDYATVHNFHLFGPGVNQATSVDNPEEATWVVTTTDGKYTYMCDIHTTLKGTFTSGTVVTPPPAPKKLVAQVGPKSSISLKTAGGARVKQLKAGAYNVTVKDRSTADNFHLTAPGINKKTGVKSRTTVTWKLTFRAGTGKYRSDAHARLRGTFRVVPAS